MARQGRWKLIHYVGMRPELFDLESDPGELHDLASAPGHARHRQMPDRPGETACVA